MVTKTVRGAYFIYAGSARGRHVLQEGIGVLFVECRRRSSNICRILVFRQNQCTDRLSLYVILIQKQIQRQLHLAQVLHTD